MSIQEARRAAFEKWYAAQGKHNYLGLDRVDTEIIIRAGLKEEQRGEYFGAQQAWLDWNAAIDSVCVVLPENCVYADPDGDYARGNRQGKREYRNAIEAAGIRCEVKK